MDKMQFQQSLVGLQGHMMNFAIKLLSLIHISEPTRRS